MSAFLVLGITVLSEKGEALFYAKLQEVRAGNDLSVFFRDWSDYTNEKVNAAFIYFSKEEAQKHVDEWNDHLMRCGISAL